MIGLLVALLAVWLGAIPATRAACEWNGGWLPGRASVTAQDEPSAESPKAPEPPPAPQQEPGSDAGDPGMQEPGGEPPGQQDPAEPEPAEDKPGEDEPGMQEPAEGQGDSPQDTGDADLEAAIELKNKATTTRELDKVVELCRSAIAKGLDASSKKLAEAMLRSTLFDHAQQLMNRVEQRDSRWRFLRREALQRLKQLLEIDPQMAEAHLMTARLSFLEGGDIELGRQSVDKAVEFAGSNQSLLADALLLRAATAEDDEERLADLNQAIVADPQNQRARIVRGEYYLGRGQLDEAIADFKMILEAETEPNPQILVALAESLRRNDKPAEALPFINRAIEIDTSNATFFALRAEIHSDLDQKEEARKDVETALEIDADDVPALLQKTRLCLESRDYDAALTAVEKALAVQPGLVNGLMLRSLVYSGQEQYDKAIADMQSLIDFNPSYTPFRLQLAAYQNAAKKWDEAVKIYDDVLESEPENADAVRGRGDVYLALGEHRKAIADYERAIELQGDEPDAGTVNNLAWVLATSLDQEIRDGRRSVELGLRACELSEYKESYALSTLAAGYAEIGDFEKAREWATKAVEVGEAEGSATLDNLKKELEAYQQNQPWREFLKEDFAGPEGSYKPKTETAPAPAGDPPAEASGEKDGAMPDDGAPMTPPPAPSSGGGR